MAVRGFWQAALADPGRRALIEPDGRILSAGELAGASHQLVHALRARGLARGDVVAMLLPNAAPALEVLLAAMQGGWYITPLNTNLAPPEIAHILRDSGARAFVADAREGERARRAADEAELPAAARIAVGELPGFASYAALKREQPATLPTGSLRRAVHAVHLGHDGQAQGHQARPDRDGSRRDGGVSRPATSAASASRPAARAYTFARRRCITRRRSPSAGSRSTSSTRSC